MSGRRGRAQLHGRGSCRRWELMRAVLCAILIAGRLAAADNSITSEEAQDGWILIFDGQSLAGWVQEGNGKWKIANGIVSFDGADSGTMRTKAAFSDYVLKLEFRASAAPDTGVFLRISGDGPPLESGYELRLRGSDSALLSESAKRVFALDGRLGANQWHTLEAELNGDKFSVKIDGRGSGDGSDGKSKAGFIALAGIRGAAVDFRNIKLKPIGTHALFNGADLSGWKSVGEPPAKESKGFLKGIEKALKPKSTPKEATWSVANGIIHGANGPGQLESQTAYDDFVLQLGVRVNSKNKGHHPKAGVTLRGDAGKLGTGYEVQVENEVSTGSIAGLKPARPILGKDNEFFTETIAGRGRHFEIWVDGYRVNEYDDTRTEGPSTKKEARTTGGPIALLAPEGDANLDFRGIKIEALPKTLGGRAGAVAAATPPPALASPPTIASPGIPAAPPSVALPAVPSAGNVAPPAIPQGPPPP